jgi:transcriptional regulator with XRE-family HTH domain
MITQCNQALGYISAMKKSAINPEIGNRIAQARAQLGLTQRAFAARLKVTQGLVGAWENHTKTPGAETLKKISDETGISMNAISGDGPLIAEALKITERDEIKLISTYRRLPSVAKKNVIELIEMTANVGRVQQKKRSPAEV